MDSLSTTAEHRGAATLHAASPQSLQPILVALGLIGLLLLAWTAVQAA